MDSKYMWGFQDLYRLLRSTKDFLPFGLNSSANVHFVPMYCPVPIQKYFLPELLVALSTIITKCPKVSKTISSYTVNFLSVQIF